MRLSLAYSLLVQQEIWNRNRFDVLSTTLQLMEEDETDLDDAPSIIDLTLDDNLSVAEFIDLLKSPELFDLCSSSSDSSTSSSSSGLKPRGLLQRGVNDSLDSNIDSDISSAGTDGHPGLPHPQLIGTLIKFKRQHGSSNAPLPAVPAEEQQLDGQEIGLSVLFFLSETRLQKRPLHLEHPDCSRLGLKMKNNKTMAKKKVKTMEEEKNVVVLLLYTIFNTIKCRNLSDPERN